MLDFEYSFGSHHVKMAFSYKKLRAHSIVLHILVQCPKTFHISYHKPLQDIVHDSTHNSDKPDNKKYGENYLLKCFYSAHNNTDLHTPEPYFFSPVSKPAVSITPS